MCLKTFDDFLSLRHSSETCPNIRCKNFFLSDLTKSNPTKIRYDSLTTVADLHALLPSCKTLHGNEQWAKHVESCPDGVDCPHKGPKSPFWSLEESTFWFDFGFSQYQSVLVCQPYLYTIMLVLFLLQGEQYALYSLLCRFGLPLHSLGFGGVVVLSMFDTLHLGLPMLGSQQELGLFILPYQFASPKILPLKKWDKISPEGLL